MLRRRRSQTQTQGPTVVHQHIDGTRAPVEFDEAIRTAFDAHVHAFLGEPATVYHEIVSDLVHIDVYMWRPTNDREMYTFVTSGMSDGPMTVPTELTLEADRAELVLCLPPDWPVMADDGDGTPWDDERFYFPIRWLKTLARLPHEFDTWLGFGHTVPNGEPPRALAPNTGMAGWAVLPPVTLPDEFGVMRPEGLPSVAFFGIVGLYPDELALKRANGIAALFDGFERHGVSELLNPHRGSSLG